MTLYEFHMLSMNEQATHLWQQQPLDERLEGDHAIFLYSCVDFYAEVFYDRILNRIVKIRAFRALHLLTPYLLKSSNG